MRGEPQVLMESVLAVEEEVGKCLETGLLAFPTKLEKSLQRTKGKHTLRGRTFISVDIRVSQRLTHVWRERANDNIFVRGNGGHSFSFLSPVPSLALAPLSSQ